MVACTGDTDIPILIDHLFSRLGCYIEASKGQRTLNCSTVSINKSRKDIMRTTNPFNRSERANGGYLVPIARISSRIFQAFNRSLAKQAATREIRTSLYFYWSATCSGCVRLFSSTRMAGPYLIASLVLTI